MARSFFPWPEPPAVEPWHYQALSEVSYWPEITDDDRARLPELESIARRMGCDGV